jgi:Flp pilus assembly secretin CpaC
VKLNQRTIDRILRAEVYMEQMGIAGFQYSFSQGSYSSSVAASAGTHDGGGAIDIRTSIVNNDKKKVDAMVVALRKAGFAAWTCC